jgi:hypothetical protein
MKGIKLYGDKTTGLLVSEPQVRVIKVPVYDIKQGRDSYNSRRGHYFRPYTLAFPYLYMWPGSHVGMSKLPPEELLATKDKFVYPLPLPNSYENCSICGISGVDIIKYAEMFWNSNFCEENSGYYGGRCLPQSTMKNLRTWEKLTALNPNFILSEACKFGTEPIHLPWHPPLTPAEQKIKDEEDRVREAKRQAEVAERRRLREIELQEQRLRAAQEKQLKEAAAQAEQAKIKEKMLGALKRKGLL